MNRIDATFAKLKEDGRKAFVAYVSGGDPDSERSLEILCALADAGADIIELGLPFSDPLADGIVNQLAADRALKAGATTEKMLQLIRDFRKTHETPLVLFTYLNPVFTYGYQRFHADAAAAGADGILLLDLPPDEAARNADLAEGTGLHHIQLIAPTTPEDRVKLLAESSQGFIYALSRTGVTGAHGAPSEGIGQTVDRIKKYTETPVCVGFGITTPEQAALVASVSDGIIVGSAIVKTIETNAEDKEVAAKVGGFVSSLVQAIR
ncbi:MAG: tryptophan synthase subunit alpha [Verrucomicrobiota bacterium JB023]|nr:tryptophan synthase subunit alpha [Verrucomicrobiota bacterium JB023]